MNAGLYDIAELGPLKYVAEKHNISFVAIGSVPRRLMLANVANMPVPSLHWLSRGTSDIDLVHTGPASASPDIVRDIYYMVPFAEAFRWQVVASESRENYELFLSGFAHRIPDNRIFLTSNGLFDPERAFDAYKARQVIFSYNVAYSRGRVDEIVSHGDSPIFAALMYIRNFLEAAEYLYGLSLAEQSSIPEVKSAVADASDDVQIDKIIASRYLSNRLFYLFSAMVSQTNAEHALETVIQTFDMRAFLKRLGSSGSVIGKKVSSIVDDASLRRARIIPAAVAYRMRIERTAVQNWEIESAAAGRLAAFVGPELVEQSDEPLLVSEALLLEPGVSACSGIVRGESHEMLHLYISMTAEVLRIVADIADEHLGVLLGFAIGEGDSDEPADMAGLIFGVPSSFERIHTVGGLNGGLQVRMNAYGLFQRVCEEVAKDGKRAYVRIFVVRHREMGEDTTLEPTPTVPVVYHSLDQDIDAAVLEEQEDVLVPPQSRSVLVQQVQARG